MKTTRLFAFLLCICTQRWVETYNETNDFFRKLLPPNYKTKMAPIKNRTEGKNTFLEPALVYFRIRPEVVTAISMKDMEFCVDLTVRVEWFDHRLNMADASKYIQSDTDLPHQVEERLWRPDIRFKNVKMADDKIVDPNQLRISSQMSKEAFAVSDVGLRVYYRKTYRFTCNINFSAYPFDVQVCEIQILMYTKTKPFYPVVIKMSTGVTTEEIRVPPGFRLRKFGFEHRHNSTRTMAGEDFVIIHKALLFRIRRVFAQHIMLIFLPSILVVTLSWLSFWLDAGNPAPRVALGLTTLLTLSTQFTAAQKDLPPVADVKALDIWMFSCMFMVFASLVEFGIAHLIKTGKTENVQKVNPMPRYVYAFNKSDAFDQLPPTTVKSNTKVTFLQRLGKCCSCCKVLKPQPAAVKIDVVARIAFPICFLIFNIAFWSHYVP